MKNLFLLLFSICQINSVAFAQGTVDTLTNELILHLTKSGLSSSIIVNKIKTSVSKFNLSTNDLIFLSSNGVHADVINEMLIQKNSQPIDESPNDLKNPLKKKPTGIYYYNLENADRPLKKIDPTVTSNSSSSSAGSLFGGLTYGLASNKISSSISGAHSRFVINEDSPVFYFYFDNREQLSTNSWFFATASSPNEFVLVKLKENDESRSMKIGSANAYGSSYGVSEKDKVPFDYSDEGNGIYKVTFAKALKKGEYCFVYASANPNNYSNDKVFDFSIQLEKDKKKK